MSQTAASPSVVFIVDDDEGLTRLAARALSRNGYSVSTVTSAAEAIAWLKEKQPDLLLLDLKLSDFGARDVLMELAKHKRVPPFVIITGQGDERVAVSMMKSGALDYLVKDNDFLEHLPSAVERVLKQIEKEKKLAEAEQALRLSEERFRVALKSSSITVSQQDIDLRYTWIQNLPANQAEEAFLGKTDNDIYPLEEADRMTQIKARVIATGLGLRQEISTTADGSRRYYDLTIEPIRAASGEISGITCAAMDITDRKRLEDEVLRVSEREQRRIGQDLHDGICQALTGIEMKSQVLEQALAKNDQRNAAQAEKIAAHVRDVISQTRSLARGLSPFILESEGLFSALTELAANTAKDFRVRCSFACDARDVPADVQVTAHLYRIAQEAIANALKHGKASEIGISISEQAGKFVLTITDNGKGFDTSARAAKGMGLRIMRYRAGIIGATVLVQAGVPGGVTIVCFLPMPGRETTK